MSAQSIGGLPPDVQQEEGKPFFSEKEWFGYSVYILTHVSKMESEELGGHLQKLAACISKLAERRLETEMSQLVKDAEELKSRISDKKLSGETVAVEEIVRSQFFQSLGVKMPGELHEWAKSHFVPKAIRDCSQRYSNDVSHLLNSTEVVEWFARVLQVVLSPEQIKKFHELSSAIPKQVQDRLTPERTRLGNQLWDFVQEEKFDVTDCNALISLLACNNPHTVIEFANSYLKLSSAAGEFDTLYQKQLVAGLSVLQKKMS